MAKRIEVNLFGKSGQRSLEIQPRGGFPTRHVKVPHEPVPSIFSPVTPEMVEADRKAKHEKPPIFPDSNPQPQSDPVVDPEAVIDVLLKVPVEAAADGWFIIDEILYIATTKFGIRANHTTLLAAFRTLYQQKRVHHKRNRFKQHTFKLANVKLELAKVDANYIQKQFRLLDWTKTGQDYYLIKALPNATFWAMWKENPHNIKKRHLVVQRDENKNWAVYCFDRMLSDILLRRNPNA